MTENLNFANPLPKAYLLQFENKNFFKFSEFEKSFVLMLSFILFFLFLIYFYHKKVEEDFYNNKNF